MNEETTTQQIERAFAIRGYNNSNNTYNDTALLQQFLAIIDKQNDRIASLEELIFELMQNNNN